MSNYVSKNTEILQVVESVASEKGITVETVIEAIEQGMKVAAKKKYGAEYDIEVDIDRSTGGFNIYRRLEVVKEVVDRHVQISLEEVDQPTNSDQKVKIGDHVTQSLPPIDLKRLVAQVVKQVIVQKVKVAEKEKQYDLFKDRVGEIINGVVKKISPRGVLLDIGGVEAFLSKDECIYNENLSQNDRVRACIKEVVRKDTGVQVYLSRTSDEFMKKLFMQEVPEIYDGIINIKAIAREPGSKAKIAVQAVESNLDPVGACVGIRGSRVQVVINELKGEKIDIVEWSSDPATFIVNSLVPARVLKVVIDEDNNRMETVVSQKDYSIAIGRRGQNARLASKITGWNIDILTEESESELRKDEAEKIYNLFVTHLGLDEMVARVLMSEGFSEIEDFLMVDVSELAKVEGFTEEKAQEVIDKVKKFSKSVAYSKLKWELLNLNKDLMKLKNMDSNIAQYLSRNNIKDVEHVADLSREEFKDIIPDDVLAGDEKVDELIMSARKIVFN